MTTWGTCYNTLTSDLSQYRCDCQLGYMGKFISPWQHGVPATTPWPLTSRSTGVTASWDTWVSFYHHDNWGTCYNTLTSDLSQYRCDCQLGYMGKFISPWQHVAPATTPWPLTSHSIDVTASWDTWVSLYHHDNWGTCYNTLTSDLSQYRCDCQLGYMGKFISPWQLGHLLQHPDLWPLTV